MRTDRIGTNYTFNAAAQTVTFTAVNPVIQELLISIVNATRDTTIYDPTVSGRGGTCSGAVVTLDFDTTAHANTDKLIILYAELSEADPRVVSGIVAVSNLPVTQPVSGPLTDVQLRAAAVPVSGPVTDAQLRATAVPVSGPLTDIELRAAAVPVSGPLTDAEIRATPVPVSMGATPTGAATEAKQDAQITQETAAAASLAVMDDWDESDRAKINPVVGQAGVQAGSGPVDAKTQRVVLATDDPAVTLLTDIASAVNREDTASINAGKGIPPLAVRTAAPADTSTTDGDFEYLLIKDGRLYTRTKIDFQTTKALTNAAVTASSSGENTLVSGTAAQTIRVFKIVLVAASAASVSFKDAAGGTSLTGAMPLTANGAMVLESNDGEPLFVSATAGAFILNLSAAVTVTGFVQYTKS